MQEMANKQKRITLKTIHQMLDGMSVELVEKVHLLFMANYIDYSDYDFRDDWKSRACFYVFIVLSFFSSAIPLSVFD
jgi:hypothetical protein